LAASCGKQTCAWAKAVRRGQHDLQTPALYAASLAVKGCDGSVSELQQLVVRCRCSMCCHAAVDMSSLSNVRSTPSHQAKLGGSGPKEASCSTHPHSSVHHIPQLQHTTTAVNMVSSMQKEGTAQSTHPAATTRHRRCTQACDCWFCASQRSRPLAHLPAGCSDTPPHCVVCSQCPAHLDRIGVIVVDVPHAGQRLQHAPLVPLLDAEGSDRPRQTLHSIAASVEAERWSYATCWGDRAAPGMVHNECNRGHCLGVLLWHACDSMDLIPGMCPTRTRQVRRHGSCAGPVWPSHVL
jgi:hypothetical protein